MYEIRIYHCWGVVQVIDSLAFYRLLWSPDIYGVTVSDPAKMILSLLESSSPIFLQSPSSSDHSEAKKRYW